MESLNKYLDLDLTVDDVRAVFKGPLFKTRWSRLDLVKAYARYFYCSRIRRARIDPRQTRVPSGS